MAQRHLRNQDYAAARTAAEAALQREPKSAAAWRAKIVATVGAGEYDRAVALYHNWRELLGRDDHRTLRAMATQIVWQGIQSSSDKISADSIGIVDRHEIEALADAVRERLGDDSDLVAARAAVAVLTSHPAAPRIAVDLLRSGQAQVRVMVVRGIGTKIGLAARKNLLPLTKDPAAAVRKAMVTLLAKWQRSNDISLLVAMAATDADIHVRTMALRGLVGYQDRAVFDLAQESLAHENLGYRMAALSVLASQEHEGVNELLRKIADSNDLSLAVRAAVALHKRTGTNMEATIERAYRAAAWSTRVAAIQAASDAMERKGALEFAGRAMADERLEVRLAAARLLLYLGVTGAAMTAFSEALFAPRWEPRLGAALDLARHGKGRGVEVLSQLAQRGSLAQRLAALRGHESVNLLTDGVLFALGDTNIVVRLAGASAVFAHK